jgi:hypothetical protein
MADKSDSIIFPIDHFGVVSAPLFKQLLTQDGDKRKRKSAFNAIRTMCKQFGLLPKDAQVWHISLDVDAAGQIAYRIDYTTERPHDKLEQPTEEYLKKTAPNDICPECLADLFNGARHKEGCKSG